MTNKIRLVFEMPVSVATETINQIWRDDGLFAITLSDKEIEKIVKYIKQDKKEVVLKYGSS